MEKLLKWSLEAAASKDGTAPANKPDEKLLAELFGQPDESQQMTNAVLVATNPEATLEAKETALDNLEMLVENLDNANNMEKIGLWKPLLTLLQNSQTHASIKKMICWILGTAVQNNESSQKDLVSKEGVVQILLELASSPSKENAHSVTEKDNAVELRLKALYALTSLLGHCQPAYEKFNDNNGWSVLSSLFEEDFSEGHERLQLRAMSLIHALSDIETDKTAKIDKIRSSPTIIPGIFRFLETTKKPHHQERALQAISMLAQSGLQLTDAEKKSANEVRDKLISEEVVHKDECIITK